MLCIYIYIHACVSCLGHFSQSLFFRMFALAFPRNGKTLRKFITKLF